jgi:hypothetical protein
MATDEIQEETVALEEVINLRHHNAITSRTYLHFSVGPINT